MNPTLIEYFAAHETLADMDHPSDTPIDLAFARSLPKGSLPSCGDRWQYQAKARAKLRFIRAKAMAEEAERVRDEGRVMSPEQQRQTEEVLALMRSDPMYSTKTTNLSFSEALEAMKAGKRVKRKDWTRGHAELGPVTIIHATATGFTEYALNDVGMDNAQATDWQIVEEA